jgi:hypothetical protein
MSAEAICSTAVGLANLSRGVYTLQPPGGSNRRRASGDWGGSPFPNSAMQVNDAPVGLPSLPLRRFAGSPTVDATASQQVTKVRPCDVAPVTKRHSRPHPTPMAFGI